MTKLIILQILMIAVRSGRSREEAPTTVIQDTRTEMYVEEVNGLSRGDFDYFRTHNEADTDLDFDYEEEDVRPPQENYPQLSKEHLMKETMLKAMKKPAIREQIAEVIPILRAMSPMQRLTLAALVSSQIMSQGRLNLGWYSTWTATRTLQLLRKQIPEKENRSHSRKIFRISLEELRLFPHKKTQAFSGHAGPPNREENLTEMAATFAGKNVKNLNDRQNITEHLLLPISVDIAKIFKGLGKDFGRSLRLTDYDQDRRPLRKQFRRKNYISRHNPNRRMDVFLEEEAKSTPNATKELQNLINEGVLQPSINDCEYFSSSFCLEVSDYPLDAIIKSVEKHRGVMDTLLEDFRIQSPEANGEGYTPERQRMRRRQDTGVNEIRDGPNEKEFMCPSSVKYARPKRARTTSGQWKYIVNAGDYTQTLRLEMCLKPMAPCSYVTNNFHSQCRQVYNYHRLLTWEENKGLHMDIFKVPSCCSCHIQGYNSFYPPNKDFSYAEIRREPIALRPSYNPESADGPFLANPSGKREIVRPPPAIPTTTPSFVPSVSQRLTPLHHLVPPGPPLPLEGEGIRFRSDVNFHTKRGSGEHRRVAEIAPHKLEIGEPPRIKFSNVALGSRNHERSPIFVPAPAKYKTGEDIKHGNGLENVEKLLRKTFESETVKPRVIPITTAATTTTTTEPSFEVEEQERGSGRKKINYNYHPIIEFFIPDYENSTSRHYSKPFNAALASQEWTPVVGRGRT